MNKLKIDRDSNVPYYRQLERWLIGEIRKGVYNPGDPLPSIAELDKELSLGRVTIVRAMRELVEDRFAKAVHGKGFFVTAKGAKKLVGLAAPFHTVYMQIYVNLAAGARDALDKINHDVMLFQTNESHREFVMGVEDLIDSSGCKYLILVPPMDEHGNVAFKTLAFIYKIRRSGIPIAIVDRRVPSDFFQINQDRHKGNHLLLELCARKDLRKVLFLGRNCILNGTMQKILCADAAKLSSSMELSFLPIESDLPKQVLEIAADGYDAVLCEEDFTARKIADVFTGETIPFALAGYNGMPCAHSIRPRITTVNSNLAGAAQLAVDYLFSKGKSSSRAIEVEPFIMEGETL